MKLLRLYFLSIFLLTITLSAVSQNTQLALAKYNGGGDWYANPTSLTNLIAFCNKSLYTLAA